MFVLHRVTAMQTLFFFIPLVFEENVVYCLGFKLRSDSENSQQLSDNHFPLLNLSC